MNTQEALTTTNSASAFLKLVKELVYDKCGFDLSNLKQNLESKDYEACSFELNGKTIQHRVSKITPTKTGQFVAIWKRNKDNCLPSGQGITEPFNISDDIDFIIITSKSGNNFGQFIFPKSVLAENGIITSKGKIGKRGMRVYPPWDIVTSKQAAKTQSWQTKYFLALNNVNSTDLELTKQLLTKKSEVD